MGFLDLRAWVLLGGLTLVAACRSPSASTNDTDRSARRMNQRVVVPHANVTSCHEELRRVAPSLWAAFQGQVKVANGGDTALARLDQVLALRDKAWEAYLVGGGNPRLTESTWDCCVGDLAEAVVDEEVAAVGASTEPPERKRQRLAALRELVERRLDWTDRAVGMKLTLDIALGGHPG